MSKLSVVSLFAGAGGLDAGFHAAGFETIAGVEIDKDCCETLAANWDWPVISKSIEDVKSSDLLSIAGLSNASVDVVIGGPPCQPFSKSGYWVNGDTRRLNDLRANTLHEYMRIVEELLPKVFVIENVHGMSYSGKEEGFRFVDDMTAQINARQGTSYQISWQVLNSASYGVPQLRERLFLVACRDGCRFRFPSPSHRGRDAQSSSLFDAENAFVAAWDAIGNGRVEIGGEDLHVRGRWADLLPSIPEGENYSWHTGRKGGLPPFRPFRSTIASLALGHRLSDKLGTRFRRFYRRLSDEKSCGSSSALLSIRLLGLRLSCSVQYPRPSRCSQCQRSS
jgi:DNA (cytosine-5)-methyltransferase 1